MKQIHNRLFILIVGTILLTILTMAQFGFLQLQAPHHYFWGLGIVVGLSLCGWLVSRYLIHWCIYPVFHQFFIVSDNESTVEEGLDFPNLPELSHLQKHLHYMASHLREIERELEEKYLELDQAQKIKAEFVENMSSELWLPLNSILGLCETLQIQALSEAQNQLVQIIFISGQDLKQMITNLQIFAELDSGKTQNNPKWIDLKPFIEELVEETLSTVDQTLFQLESEWEATIPQQVFFDRQLLRLMFFNLIRTTIKITKGGTLKLRMSQENGQMLRFSIVDPGNTMTHMTVERLFERFSPESDHSPFSDLGVSLALTKELAELLGGEAESEKDPEEGRSFWFQIPLAPTQELEQGRDAEAFISAEDLSAEAELLKELSTPHEKPPSKSSFK